MAYYDKIANQWHKITGYSGGAFKKHVLNERILGKLISIEGKSILELGAGNGYFMPFVFRKFSGQQPSQVFITDVSTKMLELAKKHFPVEGAEYRQLDVRGEFPFSDESVDIIMAAMVFNELSRAGLRKALMQCSRVLKHDGRCIVTVLHPAFVRSIAKREKINKSRGMLPDNQSKFRPNTLKFSVLSPEKNVHLHTLLLGGVIFREALCPVLRYL